MGRLHVRLSDDLEKKLELLAERLETTKSGVVKQAIGSMAELLEEEQQQQDDEIDIGHLIFHKWWSPEVSVAGPKFSTKSSLIVSRPSGLPLLIPRGKLTFVRLGRRINVTAAGFQAVITDGMVHDVKIQLDGHTYRPNCNLEGMQQLFQAFLFLHPPFRLEVDWERFPAADATLTRVDVLTGEVEQQQQQQQPLRGTIDVVSASESGPHIHGLVTSLDGEELYFSVNGIDVATAAGRGIGILWTYRSGEEASFSINAWVAVNVPESWQDLQELSAARSKKAVKKLRNVPNLKIG